MDAPDELVGEVRDVVRVWLDGTDAGRFTNDVVRAVLSVPALAEVIARDVKVREAWMSCDGDQSDLEMALSAIFAPEAGK